MFDSGQGFELVVVQIELLDAGPGFCDFIDHLDLFVIQNGDSPTLFFRLAALVLGLEARA